MKKIYTSPSEFSSDFSEAYKKYWDDLEKIEAKIEQLQEEKEKLFYPRLEEQLQKIAPEIQKALKADAFEVSRHGGLSNRTSLWFTKGKPKKMTRFPIQWDTFASVNIIMEKLHWYPIFKMAM